jgi:hypothetical protein
VEGNLLDEKPKDPMEVAMQKKILDSRNKFEDLIQMAKNSEQGMNFLYSSLSNLVEPLQKITPATRDNKQDEYESFLSSKFQMKSIYIHQMISSRKGDAKELRRARR